MTSYLIATVLILLVTAAVAVVRRVLDNDGGPRSEPMPRVAESWHPRLPSHPYATNH